LHVVNDLLLTLRATRAVVVCRAAEVVSAEGGIFRQAFLYLRTDDDWLASR